MNKDVYDILNQLLTADDYLEVEVDNIDNGRHLIWFPTSLCFMHINNFYFVF